MGCDFFFEGNLADATLQEKVIDFVKDYFGSIDLMIYPNENQLFRTEMELPRIGPEYAARGIQHEDYPFNFFGFIPFIDNEYDISDAGQFVFDRNDNGRLVKIRRLPESFGILPHRYCQEEKIADVASPVIVNIPENDSPQKIGASPSRILGRVIIPVATPDLSKEAEGQPCQESRPQYEVVIDDGGYHRVGGGMGFALLLTICKLRWWPDLQMGDDYENCEIVAALIAKWGMKDLLKDEALDFPACFKIFDTAYKNEFSSSPEIQASVPNFVDLEIVNANISMLELSIRLQNVFNNYAITTIGDIVSNSVDDFFRFKNFGRKSANEIEAVLAEHGLLLRESVHGFEITEDGVICNTINPKMNASCLAQEYLDFTAKINPYLKAGKELFDC